MKSKLFIFIYLRGDFKDRVESHEEIESILQAVFSKKSVIDEKEYISLVENVKSEIFIYVSFIIKMQDYNLFTRKKAVC